MKKLLIALTTVLFFSCGETDITSIKDPNYSQVQFNRIFVVAAFSDLEYRIKTESAFKKQLEKRGVNVVRSIDMFPPTREVEISHYEIEYAIVDHNIQAVLIIATSYYWEDIYPSRGMPPIIENSDHFGGWSSYLELRLIDMLTENTAWIATTHTKDHAFAGVNTLINSMASTSVNTLFQDGLVSDIYYRPMTKGLLEELSLDEEKNKETVLSVSQKEEKKEETRSQKETEETIDDLVRQIIETRFNREEEWRKRTRRLARQKLLEFHRRSTKTEE
ncbi:MAG: hypothetical protein GWO20_05585 [Candidatus Korarchaeota archaeon]|nr:hypothetical protein [Candidatus Korarchaeota archaeon]